MVSYVQAKVAAVEASSSQPEEESDLPVVDMDTFEQILELDEDEDMEFSSEMVWQYFEQAEQAFTDMEAKLCVVISHTHSRLISLALTVPI